MNFIKFHSLLRFVERRFDNLHASNGIVQSHRFYCHLLQGLYPFFRFVGFPTRVTVTRNLIITCARRPKIWHCFLEKRWICSQYTVNCCVFFECLSRTKCKWIFIFEFETPNLTSRTMLSAYTIFTAIPEDEHRLNCRKIRNGLYSRSVVYICILAAVFEHCSSNWIRIQWKYQQFHKMPSNLDTWCFFCILIEFNVMEHYTLVCRTHLLLLWCLNLSKMT